MDLLPINYLDDRRNGTQTRLLRNHLQEIGTMFDVEGRMAAAYAGALAIVAAVSFLLG